MLFDSAIFWLFCGIIFFLYWLMRSAKVQNALLLLASLVFYGCFDWRFLGLFVAMAVWTYLFGMILIREKKKSFIWFAVLGPVVTLCFFKYYNFFVESVTFLFSAFHLQLSKPTVDILLPIGISFYTFMAISYLVDVYKGRFLPERNWLTFSVYFCFFPQLVAGPIGRAPEIVPQFRKERRFDYAVAVEACRQILWGAFAKFVVADNCNTIVSTLLSCGHISRGMLAVSALAYTIQIYGDFSGYSNMAVGIGKLFGIRLRQNFAYPYFATSFSEFWRRWHISLTTWFRDYVYFPLGGSRCSLAKTIRNTWIVFLLSGLWHGAAWTFVVWGGLHALYVTGGIFGKRMCWGSNHLLVRWMIVMVGVMLAWLLFYAHDFGDIEHYMESLVFSSSSAIWPRIHKTTYVVSIISAVILFVCEWVGFMGKCEFGLSRVPSRRFSRLLIYLFLTLLIICCTGDGSDFIYQKF